jgi:hypothetical protein
MMCSHRKNAPHKGLEFVETMHGEPPLSPTSSCQRQYYSSFQAWKRVGGRWGTHEEIFERNKKKKKKSYVEKL